MIDNPVLAALLERLAGATIAEMREDFNEQYEGWWCIQHRPGYCPSCRSILSFVEPGDAHLIVVWEEKSDDSLIDIAAKLQRAEWEPRVVTYHPMLGNCIPSEDVRTFSEYPS